MPLVNNNTFNISITNDISLQLKERFVDNIFEMNMIIFIVNLIYHCIIVNHREHASNKSDNGFSIKCRIPM